MVTRNLCFCVLLSLYWSPYCWRVKPFLLSPWSRSCPSHFQPVDASYFTYCGDHHHGEPTRISSSSQSLSPASPSHVLSQKWPLSLCLLYPNPFLFQNLPSQIPPFLEHSLLLITLEPCDHNKPPPSETHFLKDCRVNTKFIHPPATPLSPDTCPQPPSGMLPSVPPKWQSTGGLLTSLTPWAPLSWQPSLLASSDPTPLVPPPPWGICTVTFPLLPPPSLRGGCALVWSLNHFHGFIPTLTYSHSVNYCLFAESCIYPFLEVCAVSPPTHVVFVWIRGCTSRCPVVRTLGMTRIRLPFAIDRVFSLRLSTEKRTHKWPEF